MKERPILFSAPMVRALLDETKTQTRRVAKVEITMGRESISGPRHGRYSSVYFLDNEHDLRDIENACPYGQPGDRLWAKETTVKVEDHGYEGPVYAESDYGRSVIEYGLCPDPDDVTEVEPEDIKLRPSIFMPKAMSRITLEIVRVRLERLQDISEVDAIAEGCKADQPETWWQGYKDIGDSLGLQHTQTTGEEPPDWMIEPHKMNPTPWLVRGAKTYYQTLWQSINGPGSWDVNPYVWVVEFKVVKP